MPADRIASFRTLSLGGSVVRTLLVLLLGLATYIALAHLHQSLDVDFEMRVDHSGPVEIYYDVPGSHFDPRLRETRRAAQDSWQRYSIAIRGYRAIQEVRIDPLTQPGRFEISEVRLSSRWAERRLQGEALRAALHPNAEVKALDTTPQGISFQSTGADPFLSVKIPKAFFQPDLGVVIPRGLLWGLKIAAVWLLLEVLVSHLARRQPALYARVRRSFVHGWALPLLLCAGLTYHSERNITDSPVLGDGIQNLLIATNLYKHGVFSHEGGANPQPTNFREPLPPMVAYAYLALFAPNHSEHLGFGHFRAGELTRFVKMSNLIWVFTGLLGVWLLTRRLTHSIAATLAATLLTYVFFFNAREYIDTFYTELTTATAIVWGSYLLYRGVKDQKIGYFLAGGAAMGLLALTKASSLYINLVALLLLVAVMLFARQRMQVSVGRIATWGLAMGLGLAVVVAPWMVRNHLQFDSMRISDRGGLILHGRATLNNMTNDEVIGLIYEKSPTIYRKLVDGTRFGQTDRDEFERGGRWQRLNRGLSSFWKSDIEAIRAGRPDLAVSFHAEAGARYTILLNQLRVQGNHYPEEVVDGQRRDEAIRMLKERPVRHLFMTLPFFWHGFWGLKKVEIPLVSLATQDTIVEVLNLLAGLALLTAFFVGMLRRRPDLLALTVLPFGLMSFYAFVSHNIPRYMSPAHPIMLILLVAVVAALLNAQLSRRPSPVVAAA
ncbi:glycosyltransferase family 39 protein [Hydrogenophaga taeniospiralis]|uniref:glycosyltransferase family 39 protein n=1 Tax=Hydrogenophaga taeniospiralis TaxID=65656 RepID=UPI001CFC024F|nr:glycosyltransferase family 39 protein [Hydrogenophaga taeniospiralis]MCB4364707.1 glycosyltransferase family 39 protein [Hydrogenophaga taeniospiralis]